MIDDKHVLGLIPARGGSKGVPRKNLRELRGKPLVAWTIEEARRSTYIDRLILSSEDDEIIAVAQTYGCDVPFHRPMELAQDSTPSIDVVMHALRELPEYHYVVLLQPTSPFRTAQDIDDCIAFCVRAGAPSCVSITSCREHPFLLYRADSASRITALLPESSKFHRRQDYPDFYRLNGAVYVAETTWLQQTRSFIGENTLGYQMPPERSLDIDSEEDLASAG